MSGGRYLLLFLDEHERPDWLQLDGGVIAARSHGAPPPLPDTEHDEQVVAVVPATDVAVHWVDLPPLAPAQALAAARLLAAEASAEPYERLHVALAPGGDAGEPRAMAVTSAEHMSAWLDRAAMLGLDPDRVVPESLLIAAPVDRVRRIARGDLHIVRGPMVAFAAEPELAELAADGAAAEPFDPARFESGLWDALVTAPLDLRQGPFAKRRRARIDWRHIRRLALLGVAILVGTVLIQFATLLRYSFAADRLEREVVIVAQRALPRGSGLANPPAQLADRLAELRGSGAGFGPTAAAAFAAIRDTPNVDLGTLGFDRDGSLKLGVLAGSAGDINALQQRLTAAGFTASMSEIRPGGGRQLVDITVRAP